MSGKTLTILFVVSTAIATLVGAESLPSDGGDPGKAYRECLAAVSKPDKEKMIELCFAKDDPWLKEKNLGYFSSETFQVEVRLEWPALRLVDTKITGGTIQGDAAEIFVEGKMILQRLEPTDEIVEVDRYPVKGTVQLRRKNGLWRYAGEQKLEKVY
jgi:hypothetical protein